jgi:hypothetical protein
MYTTVTRKRVATLHLSEPSIMVSTVDALIKSTHDDGVRPTQLSVQAAWECALHGWLVGVILVHHSEHAGKHDPEGAKPYRSPARRDVRVVFCRKDTQNIVVFVHRLAEVAAFLLVPPVAVRIAVLALDGWEKGVASIHTRIRDIWIACFLVCGRPSGL